MAAGRSKKSSNRVKAAQAESYQHPESSLPLRPDAGTQPQFKKKKPPQRYRYDSSLRPPWSGTARTRPASRARH